ncbi:CsbD family protein [Streptomyces sp. NPDC002055]|uniref:CsbD family protein n=1 Tax=Streptomyces sp. NPDC002055 TaxID=3154534 RepID=UPI003322AFA7
MTAQKRTAAIAEQAKGAAKEAAGRALGNDRMAAEGRAERLRGGMQEDAQKAKHKLGH